MAYYHKYICDICKARLDPGERCDCQERKESREKNPDVIFQEEKGGQLKIRYMGRAAG